jgi:hypothetical protein
MANENNYFSTPYSFVSPIRHFKANDPYYYEIDNVPIKQLEESTNFLKDQVDGLITFKDQSVEIDRKGFSELKPYATGTERAVRVKPGRYTARINNAYDLTPLQTVTQVLGKNLFNESGNFEFPGWEFESNSGPSVSAALSQLSLGILGEPYLMNGLFERAFVYPIGERWGDDFPTTLNAGYPYLNVSTPGYDYGAQDLGFTNPINLDAAYPNYEGVLHLHGVSGSESPLPTYRVQINDLVSKNQGTVESMFIKRWRGAIRTSVVDVPNELSIDIPAWDPQDFYITDEEGNKQLIGSTQRIDLLFIYSKGIDEASTKVLEFDANGNPRSLDRATLGIVKGAGIGVSRQLGGNAAGPAATRQGKNKIKIQSLEGTPLMLSHPGDYDNQLPIGFETSAGVIRGSFPSPDDLMNLAPVLSENLETTAIPLIGQSILPIAYIVVEGDGAGPITDLIQPEHIIDIRPFFRTAELAYNERAGIAAATPQISIANPVVSEAHLHDALKVVHDKLKQDIDGIQPVNNNSSLPNESRVVGCGQILGGFLYGPEGALAKQLKATINGTNINNINYASLFTSMEDTLGLGRGAMTNNPYWDKSDWYNTGDFQQTRPNDWINVADAYYVNHGIGKAGPLIGGDSAQSIGARQANNEIRGWRGSSFHNRRGQMFYVSKRINITRPNWMADYHVDVDYLNCIPMHAPFSWGAMGEGIWVDKFHDYFIINVAWHGPSWRRLETIEATSYQAQSTGYTPELSAPWATNALPLGGVGTENFGTSNPPGTALKPWSNRNDTRWFAGFGLPQINLKDSNVFKRYTPTKQGPDTYNGGLNYGYTEGTIIASNGESPASSREFTKPEYFSGEITPILYPSVSFKITGYDENHVFRARGQNGRRLSAANKTITLR